MTGCCPYGPLLLLPLLASTTAFVMTWVFTFDCRFFQATFQGISAENNKEHASLFVGLWTVQDYYAYMDDAFFYGDDVASSSSYGMCVGWNQHSVFNADEAIDGPLRFARVASMLLSLISWILLVFLLFASCMIFSPGAMQSLAWGFGLVGLCCFLCLIALASDLCQESPDCTLGRDGIICICAALIWLIAAVSILYLRPIDNNDPHNNNGRVAASAAGAARPIMSSNVARQTMVPGTEEVKIQETVASDGTVTVLTTRSLYNANGTMTVTETREVRAASAPPAFAAAAAVLADAPVEPVFVPESGVKVLGSP